jgi:hypothetical protein
MLQQVVSDEYTQNCTQSVKNFHKEKNGLHVWSPENLIVIMGLEPGKIA